MSTPAPYDPSVDVDPDSGPSRQSYIKFVEGKSPDEVNWWSKDTVAVVTGGNKGIGYEIVKRLATAGVSTVLTARDESRGVAAVDVLKAQGLENVHFHALEVTNPASAAKLKSWIQEKFGGLDILVCNAGVMSPSKDYEWAKILVTTNYDGQKIVASALLPLLKPSAAGARIVFVTSQAGGLQFLQSDKLREQLNDVDHLTEAQVDEVSAKYLEDVKAGKDDMILGGAPHYKFSRVALNAYARVLAKSLSSRPPGNKVYVNVMSPGLVSTDLNNFKAGARTVEDGADTAVWLALFPSGGPTGGSFRDRADYPFHSSFPS